MTAKKVTHRDLSLDEFAKLPTPDAWRALQAAKPGVELLKNCRTFNECHINVRAETGIWIEELVPIFNKLDASIAVVR